MGLFTDILKIGGAAFIVGGAPVAALATGAALAPSIVGAVGDYMSADEQAEAIKRAEAIQQQQYAETRGLLQPYIQGGLAPFHQQQAYAGALGPEAQQRAFDAYQQSPGVEFARRQGVEAINREASARGGLGGGNRLKRLSEYNQSLALQDFGNQYNRLGALTGVGLGAAGSLAGYGQNFAAGQSNLALQAGQAEANKIGSVSSGIRQGLSDLGTLAALGASGGFGGGAGGGSLPNVPRVADYLTGINTAGRQYSLLGSPQNRAYSLTGGYNAY